MNLTGYLITILVITVTNLMSASYLHGKKRKGKYNVMNTITAQVLHWLIIWLFLL